MFSRRKFSPEFKAEAVELVISSDRPVVQVAVDVGVNEGSRPASNLQDEEAS
jgi:transposase